MRYGHRAASSTRLRSGSSQGQSMNVDYYSLLTKAAAGKDAAARDKIYKDAYSLIRQSSLTRDAATSHIVALDGAIRQIEGEITAEEERSEAAVSEVLSTARNWKP